MPSGQPSRNLDIIRQRKETQSTSLQNAYKKRIHLVHYPFVCDELKIYINSNTIYINYIYSIYLTMDLKILTIMKAKLENTWITVHLAWYSMQDAQ